MSLPEYCGICGELLPRGLHSQGVHMRSHNEGTSLFTQQDASDGRDDHLRSPFETARDDASMTSKTMDEVLAERRAMPFIIRTDGMED